MELTGKGRDKLMKKHAMSGNVWGLWKHKGEIANSVWRRREMVREDLSVERKMVSELRINSYPDKDR